MKLWDRIKAALSIEEPLQDARMGMTPHPLTINPTDSDRLAKTRLRLQRCQQAHDEATDPAYKARMAEAVIRHRSALRAVGIKD